MSTTLPASSLRDRVRARWSSLTRRQRVHGVVLALLAVGTVALQLVLMRWYIEDAAISFAYARHLAEGEGLVTYPGGERVEGYSNPLWVFLIAAWELVGVDGFASAKIMSGVFGAACVPLVYAITREIRGPRDDIPLVAAGAVAVGAQFVIWNASGLENSLFCVLMALGIWRALVEARQGGWPWSALAFMGLAITRPEGILYAAWAGFWSMCLAFRAGRGLSSTSRWLLTFFGPFVAYHAVRYAYFAFEFPNTYYAKLGDKDFQPLSWSSRGWKYLRNWSHELWQGYLLPVYLVGAIGLVGWRKLAAVGALVTLGVVMLYPGTDALQALPFWPDLSAPRWWPEARIWALVGLAVVAPLLGLGRRGSAAVALCWGMAVTSLFFAVYSAGDWMKGFRWFSLLAVPSSVLFAAGVGELADAARRLLARRSDRAGRIGFAVAAGLVGALVLPPNIAHLAWFADRPETGPFSVQRRVNYYRFVLRRLHVLERPTVLDVDMGANMWWGFYDIADIAGLVDVPMGHHRYERPFIAEYVFGERRPHLAHVHGGWARRTRIPSHRAWDDYVELPGYPVSKRRMHIGTFVRRDLLFDRAWSGTPGREVAFADGTVLHGLDLPAPVAGRGRQVFVELGLTAGQGVGDDLRIVLFASDDSGLRHSWELAPGYDWVPPSDWRDDEVFHGRYAVELPADLPPGRYDLGVVVTGPDGVVAAASAPDGAVIVSDADEAAAGDAPRFAVGEVRFPGLLHVVDNATYDRALAELRASVDEAASAGRCDAAEDRWERTQRLAVRRYLWIDEQLPAVGRALSDCHVAAAARTEDRAERVDHLARARRWDHRNPAVLEAGPALATTLVADGDLAREQEDWSAAYRAYTDALRLDPTLAWTRRAAEEVRDIRLGLVGTDVDGSTLRPTRDPGAIRRMRPRVRELSR